MDKIFRFITLIFCFLVLPKFIVAQHTKLHDFDDNIMHCFFYEGFSFDGTHFYFYGKTNGDRLGGSGQLYKIKSDGTEFKMLISFNVHTGTMPIGKPIYDGEFIYGVTTLAGQGDSIFGFGSIYRIKPDGTEFTKLKTFDDGNPGGNLCIIGDYFYGCKTEFTSSQSSTIYRIKKDGTGYEDIFQFKKAEPMVYGKLPYSDLLFDGNHLFGVTRWGGINDKGIIFQVNIDGTGFEKLYDFKDNKPTGLLISANDQIVGLTDNKFNSNLPNVFKYRKDIKQHVDFFNYGDSIGNNPVGIAFYNNYLWFNTQYGGKYNNGSLFKVPLDGFVPTKLFDYQGVKPVGPLIGKGSKIYGTSNDSVGQSIGVRTNNIIYHYDLDSSKIIEQIKFRNIRYPNSHGDLVTDSTYLYGFSKDGIGSIFRIKINGTGFNTIYKFDSMSVNSSGTILKIGNYVYGTAFDPDGSNDGAIFKIRTNGTSFQIIKKLNYEINGHVISGDNLFYDGNFIYCLTNTIESDDSVLCFIFKIKTDGSQYEKIFDFKRRDSLFTTYMAKLAFDGNYFFGVFGTAKRDSKNNPIGNTLNECKYIFRLNKNGGNYQILHTLDSIDGAGRAMNILTRNNYLYISTEAGGKYNSGTIIRLNKDGTGFKKIYDYYDWNRSYVNNSNILYSRNFWFQRKIFINGDSIYGISQFGGKYSYGSIFRMKIDGTDFASLYDFDGNISGANPTGKFVSDGKSLFAKTAWGGLNDQGTIFKLNPNCIPFYLNQTISICPGQQIIIGKNVYSKSGIYYDKFVKKDGCDSLIVTNITVNDTSTYISNSKIISNEINAKYQWLDCSKNYEKISGATNRTYLPSKSGNYALEIIENDCVDTSTCTQVNVNCYANFETSYDTLSNSFTVIVDSTTSAFANSYHWDFGDGQTSDSATPTHVYTIDTTYNLCLKVKTNTNENCEYCNIIGKDSKGNIYRTSGFTINVVNAQLQSINPSISYREPQFIISPNPTTGLTEIQFKTNVNNARLILTNIEGRTIIEKNNISGNYFNIDLSHQSSGVYFLKIVSENNVWNGKVVKE